MTLRELLQALSEAHFAGCALCSDDRVCSLHEAYVRVLRDLREQERQGKPRVRQELGVLGTRGTR